MKLKNSKKAVESYKKEMEDRRLAYINEYEDIFSTFYKMACKNGFVVGGSRL